MCCGLKESATKSAICHGVCHLETARILHVKMQSNKIYCSVPERGTSAARSSTRRLSVPTSARWPICQQSPGRTALAEEEFATVSDVDCVGRHSRSTSEISPGHLRCPGKSADRRCCYSSRGSGASRACVEVARGGCPRRDFRARREAGRRAGTAKNQSNPKTHNKRNMPMK